MIRDTEKRIDLTLSPFPEFLLSTLCHDGKLSYKIKCVGLGIILYLIGVITCFKDGKLVDFLQCYQLAALFIVLSGTLIALTSFFRKIDDSILWLEGVICSDRIKLNEFIDGAQSGKHIPLAGAFWYYFTGIALGILGLSFFYFVVIPYNAVYLNWVTFDEPGIFKYYYLSLWFFVPFLIGCFWNKIIVGIMILREYCKKFVTADKIMPLNPDKTGGLSILGRLALELDTALAIPALLIPVYLIAGVPLKNPVVIGLIILYTAGLAVVFFLPLSSAHDAMLEAKERELLKIDGKFRKIHAKTSAHKEILDPKLLEELRSIYFLYEKVSKMVVWPLDISLILKYLFTVLFPIIIGVTTDLVLR